MRPPLRARGPCERRGARWGNGRRSHCYDLTQLISALHWWHNIFTPMTYAGSNSDHTRNFTSPTEQFLLLLLLHFFFTFSALPPPSSFSCFWRAMTSLRTRTKTPRGLGKPRGEGRNELGSDSGESIGTDKSKTKILYDCE